MRFGDLQPTQHTNFGGRLGVAYAASRQFELSLSGYKGRSHFHYDTGYEKGDWRNTDWMVEFGPNIILGEAVRAAFMIGGSVLYGEARSKLTITDAISQYQFDGPPTFFVGGRGKLSIIVPLATRFQGLVQVGAGVAKAHAKGPLSGNLFEWNGRTVSASIGIRTIIARGRGQKQ
jgi:hypothetical protein